MFSLVGATTAAWALVFHAPSSDVQLGFSVFAINVVAMLWSYVKKSARGDIFRILVVLCVTISFATVRIPSLRYERCQTLRIETRRGAPLDQCVDSLYLEKSPQTAPVIETVVASCEVYYLGTSPTEPLPPQTPFKVEPDGSTRTDSQDDGTLKDALME